MRRSKYTGMAFHYLHSILGAAFLMCGSGLRLVLNAYVPHLVASSGGSDHRRRALLEAVEGIAGDASAAAGGSGFAEDVDGVVAANVSCGCDACRCSDVLRWWMSLLWWCAVHS